MGAEQRPWTDDLSALAGRSFVATVDAEGATPIVILVSLFRAIDPIPCASAPVIVLNGEVLLNTRVFSADPTRKTLIAFVKNSGTVPSGSNVEVYWTGNEAATRTEESYPVAVRALRQ